MEENDYYLNIGKASDLHSIKERIFFRFFEILPGFLSLSILSIAFFLSFYAPTLMSIIIIIFVVFWFFRTIYFALYLLSGYRKMEAHKKINWFRRINDLEPSEYSIKGIKSWKEIYHLIIVPMYDEPYEIVREALKSVANTDYPKDKMIIVLGCEQRVYNQTYETAKKIEEEFAGQFFRFLVTWHPSDIVGEIAGKGSNETWAAKKAKQIIDTLSIPYENIVFSSFDVDTCVYPKYFSCLTYKYLINEKPIRTSFQPVPLYINNIWQAPAISRIFSFASTFWHTMNQERQEKLVTFSSHSMSFKALVDVGFKQTNIVPDDSRIFWQCFFKYNGEYKVEPMYYPLSMDANVAENFFKTTINIYKQQRRWAYGVCDIPYFLFGFIKNKKIPFSKKVTLSFLLFEGHISWATVSILLFIMGWLPLFFGGDEFSRTLLSYNLPIIISRLMTITMLGLLTSIYISFLLLPPRPLKYTRFKYIVIFFGWFLFPISTIFFTSLPALDAQMRLMFGKYMGFWVTKKVRK